jgi:hypothetical protein
MLRIQSLEIVKSNIQVATLPTPRIFEAEGQNQYSGSQEYERGKAGGGILCSGSELSPITLESIDAELRSNGVKN